jgi:hypothetical protein
MMDTGTTQAPAAASARVLTPGAVLALVLLCVYGGLALTVDFPRAALGIQSDEATYYMMGHSLAEDGDLVYRRDDLVRVWREFPSGPTGLFLKRGSDIVDAGLMLRPPFAWVQTRPDPDPSRLFYGKSFIYPVFAAPFVWLFGTNGFLVLHSILLSVVIWAGATFLRTRTTPLVAALLAGGFVMATIVPVYFVWITPELFNFSLAALAYFCWLYKEVAIPASASPRARWLFDGRSDLAAAILLGIAMYSKLNLLFAPVALWLLYRRQWGRAFAVSAVFLAVAGGLFGINAAVTGEWNYQGGDRATFLWEFPFQTPASGFDVGLSMSRDETHTEILFERSVFWTNLWHNLGYFFVGRYAGLVPYYFPAVFGLGAYLFSRRRPAWQHFVFGTAVAQILLFIIALPYTWNGDGGSVGNRYFMSTYGIFLYLIPPVRRIGVALVPWIAGSLFTAPLVLNPFASSFRPGDYAKSGPVRLFPVELTTVYAWPINTETPRVRVWFGDNPGQHDPGFQIYFFDDNAYQKEADEKSFWVKGESRAEFLIKTDRPMKRLVLTLTSGAAPTEVTAKVAGKSHTVALRAGDTQQIFFALGEGFPYQGRWPVWFASISSSGGFIPIFHGGTDDVRFLGVKVKPTLVE